MKKMITLGLLFMISFCSLHYNNLSAVNATPSIAAVIVDREAPPPVERKKKKRKKKRKKHQRKHRKLAPKQEQYDKSWVPWLLGGLSLVTLAGAIAWGMFFLPILFGGGLTFGCGPLIGLLAAIVFGFLGGLLFLVLVAGTVALIVLAVFLSKRFKERENRLQRVTNRDKKQLQEDYLAEAQDNYPNWPLEAIERYIDTKVNLVELNDELVELEYKVEEQKGRMAEKTQEEIDALKIAIAKKEAAIEGMKTVHDKLPDIPKEKHWEYIKLVAKQEALITQRKIYQEQNTGGRYDRRIEQLGMSIAKLQGELNQLLKS